MKQELVFTLLGRPALSLDGVSILERVPAKAVALLAFVATTGQAHARTALSALLWPEYDEQRARGNLRLTLARLRATAGDCLASTAGGIGPGGVVRTTTDLARFQQGVEHPEDVARLRMAVAGYKGAFLSEFSLPDADPFERWAADRRRYFGEQAIAMLTRLIEQDAGAGRLTDVLELSSRALAIEPWREEMHRWRMELLARTGHRAAALAQFQACQAALAEELDVQPEPATWKLARAIESGEVRADPARGPAPAGGAVAKREPASDPVAPVQEPPAETRLRGGALPILATALYGREPDLVRAAELLGSHECRVLSVIGPGGIGKTSFAVAVAQAVAPRFPDGVWFLSFVGAGLSDPAAAGTMVITRIAEALGLASLDLAVRRDELQRRLAGMQALLVLDNFEPLRTAAPILEDLLQAGASLKLLVTTRVRLGVSVEWLLPLAGLGLPGPFPDPTAASVALFAAHARRIEPEFDLGANLDAVARIARCVDGHPLALTMAARWLRLLTCTEIARRLEVNDTAALYQVESGPDRHGSLARVFGQSWAMLDARRQRVLAALAVFRNGCHIDAAIHVADASAADLAVLNDHSLLSRRDDGRLFLHELQRQHAAAQLQADPATAARVHAGHAQYFLDWVGARRTDLARGARTQGTAEVGIEFENLEAAQAWLLAHGTIPAVAELGACLWLFLRNTNQFARARRLFDAALARTDAAPARRAEWHTILATASYSLGQLEQAHTHIEHAAALGYRPLPQSEAGWLALVTVESARQLLYRLLPPAWVRSGKARAERYRSAARTIEGLGQIAYMLERPLEMLCAGMMELNCSERSGGAAELAHAYSGAAIMFASTGLHRVAARYGERCRVALAGAMDGAERAYAQEVLGLFQMGMGQWSAADSNLESGATSFAELGLRRTESECLQLRCAVPFRRGAYALSETRWRELLTHAREHHVLFGEFWALVSLAKLRLRSRALADDRVLGWLREAQALALDHLGVPEAIELYAALARAHASRNENARALDYALKGLRCMCASRLTTAYTLDGYAGIAECLLHLANVGADTHASWPDPPGALIASACGRVVAGARAVPILRPYASYLEGCRLYGAGRVRAARSRWRRGVAFAAGLSMPYEAMLCHRALARTAGATAASAHATRAETIRDELGIAPDELRAIDVTERPVPRS